MTNNNTQQISAGPALVVGVIGLAIAAIGLYFGYADGNPRPLVSWLLGFALWFSIIVGMLFMIMIWYIFGAKWPIIIRRQLEHAISALPYLFLIFLPLLAFAWFYGENPGILWKWMNPDNLMHGGEGTVGEDSLYKHKEPLLNLPFFTIRFFAYFVTLILLALCFRKFSFTMDSNPAAKWPSLSVKLSAAGIPATAIIVTLGAIDWYMSMDYHWFSTMYGVWYFAASLRVAIAATIILCFFLSSKSYLKGIYNKAHQYDLSCMLLAFTVFWAYISFSQYFLIYNANIPEETYWYALREMTPDQESMNAWWWVSMGLIFGNFLLPFLALLSFKLKVTKGVVFVSAWVMAFTLLDLYFNILPSMPHGAGDHHHASILDFVYDLAAIVGVGGICIFAFIKSANKTKPIPVCDPRIEYSLQRHL